MPSIEFGDIAAWTAIIASFASSFFARRKAIAIEEKSNHQHIITNRKIRIDGLASSSQLLRDMAIDYWTTAEADSKKLGIKILIKSKDISSQVHKYQPFLWPDASMDYMQIKLKITGGDFQSASRQALEPNSVQLTHIITAFDSFIKNLREEIDRDEL